MDELTQEKTDKELQDKCNEIIKSLKDYNTIERYKILTTLTESFTQLCRDEGIEFINIERMK